MADKKLNEEMEKERPLVAASRLFAHCVNHYCTLVRGWSDKYIRADMAIVLVKKGSLEMTIANYDCLDFAKSKIRDYLEQRLLKGLDETDPVMVLELLKHDEDGNKLDEKDRGMIIEGARYRVYLCLIGFQQESYLELQEKLHGKHRLMDSPFILFKEHYAHY